MPKEKFSGEVYVHAPQLTKWKINDGALSRIYYDSCKTSNYNHDPKSWATGFALAAKIFESPQFTKIFFEPIKTKDEVIKDFENSDSFLEGEEELWTKVLSPFGPAVLLDGRPIPKEILEYPANIRKAYIHGFKQGIGIKFKNQKGENENV